MWNMSTVSGAPPKVGTGEVLGANIVDMSTCVKISDWVSQVGSHPLCLKKDCF